MVLFFTLVPERPSCYRLGVKSHAFDYGVARDKSLASGDMFKDSCLHSFHVPQEDDVFCLGIKFAPKGVRDVHL